MLLYTSSHLILTTILVLEMTDPRLREVDDLLRILQPGSGGLGSLTQEWQKAGLVWQTCFCRSPPGLGLFQAKKLFLFSLPLPAVTVFPASLEPQWMI